MSPRRFLAALAAISLLASCGSDPEPAVSEQDQRLGAEQHPVLLAEFGGAYQAPEARYLERIGEKIADAAGLDGLCTFTLVNTDVVNAFAVPGCYIYVTRGLMGLVNSEAELASVLAHEVGHIVANHSGRQQKRSILRQLGVVAVGLITGSEQLTRIAGQAAQYFTLRYSRNQEYESDDLGIRYMVEAGYDPYEAADMLGALARQEQFMAQTRGVDEAKGIPEWARTHPLTESRIERARETAAKAGVFDNQLPENRPAYMAEVDGLLYGDDPEQGFVQGRRFAHPVMRIAFEAPPGFTLTNSPQAILIDGPDGLRGEFGGGRLPPDGLEGYVSGLVAQLLRGASAEAGAATRAVINGLPALIVPVLVETQQGSAVINIAAYAAPGREAYHFAMISPSGAGDALGALFSSFRLLTPAEAATLRPRTIQVMRTGSSDTIRSLAARMASDYPVPHFLSLNGREADQPLRPGELVKIVTFAGR